MIRIIFELLLFYILYKVIFDFIIPVYQSTKQVKKQFGEMQNRMDEMNRKQQQANTTAKTQEKSAPAKPKKDDYIDFEEIK